MQPDVRPQLQSISRERAVHIIFDLSNIYGHGLSVSLKAVQLLDLWTGAAAYTLEATHVSLVVSAKSHFDESYARLNFAQEACGKVELGWLEHELLTIMWTLPMHHPVATMLGTFMPPTVRWHKRMRYFWRLLAVRCYNIRPAVYLVALLLLRRRRLTSDSHYLTDKLQRIRRLRVQEGLGEEENLDL